MNYENRLRKLEAASGTNRLVVWTDWLNDAQGNATGAWVTDRGFTLEAGATPEDLLRRIRDVMGTTVAHWIMMTPTDARL